MGHFAEGEKREEREGWNGKIDRMEEREKTLNKFLVMTLHIHTSIHVWNPMHVASRMF